MDLLQKLNFKNPSHACVLEAPASFAPQVELLQQAVPTDQQVLPEAAYDFVICFVQHEAEVIRIVRTLAPTLLPDAVFWMAYPKKSSKKYKATIHRDSGWQALGDLGFEGVRAIAIDEDWSALRFRHVKYIKTLHRDPSWIMSKEGQAASSKRPKNE